MNVFEVGCSSHKKGVAALLEDVGAALIDRMGLVQVAHMTPVDIEAANRSRHHLAFRALTALAVSAEHGPAHGPAQSTCCSVPPKVNTREYEQLKLESSSHLGQVEAAVS